jgi:hypothetical protein
MTLALPHRTAAIAALLAPALAAAGCAGTITDPWSFAAQGDGGGAGPTVDAAAPACPDVPTKLAASCAGTGCHDATTRAQALDLASPGVASRLVGVPATEGAGLLVDPSNPSKSVVYTKLLASPPFGARMPTGAPLDDATIACVLDWVTSVAGSGSAAPDGGSAPVPEAGATVDAGAADGAGESGSVAPFATLRMAAGQTADVTDAQGVTWKADANYTGGTAAVESPSVGIAGTDSPVLYNGQRYGNPSFSYAFTVPDGTYTVTLKFAELYVTGPGQRLFTVAINGTTVETGFDIYAAAGSMNKAVDRSYTVSVTGGQIAIAFQQGTVQFPKVDAIAIAQGGPGDGGP